MKPKLLILVLFATLIGNVGFAQEETAHQILIKNTSVIAAQMKIFKWA